MQVRTGDQHPFDDEESRIDQFVVDSKPTLDYAAKALREAQDRYFAAYPEARKNARDYVWTIRKRSELPSQRIVNLTVNYPKASDPLKDAQDFADLIDGGANI